MTQDKVVVGVNRISTAVINRVEQRQLDEPRASCLSCGKMFPVHRLKAWGLQRCGDHTSATCSGAAGAREFRGIRWVRIVGRSASERSAGCICASCRRHSASTASTSSARRSACSRGVSYLRSIATIRNCLLERHGMSKSSYDLVKSGENVPLEDLLRDWHAYGSQRKDAKYRSIEASSSY